MSYATFTENIFSALTLEAGDNWVNRHGLHVVISVVVKILHMDPSGREIRLYGKGFQVLSIIFYIGYKRISVYGKNLASLIKSLGAKFHCTNFEIDTTVLKGLLLELNQLSLTHAV